MAMTILEPTPTKRRHGRQTRSLFFMSKWGHPRRFVVTLKDENSTVLFDKILPEGTEIIVTHRPTKQQGTQCRQWKVIVASPVQSWGD